MEKIRETFVSGALKNGVDEEIAEKVFSQLRAFAAYGFCNAHAASFAKIAYQTAYLKAHYAPEFLAGILCNEPMGFYPANVIVEEARRIGIGILGVDVNRSRKKFCVEEGNIRIGLMQVKGISDAEIKSIVDARAEREFDSFSDFCRRARVDRPTIENLVNCGAFECFGHPRGKLLWLLGEKTLGVTRQGSPSVETFRLMEVEADDQLADLPDVPEPPMHVRVRMDYEILGLSPLCHPMVFYRETLAQAGLVKCTEAKGKPGGSIVRIAGVVVTCMRPPTKSGVIVVFVTLEDEFGLMDTVIFPKVYEQYGPVIFNSPGLIIEGKVERMGERGLSIIARKIWPLTPEHRNEGISGDRQRYPERKRSAGQRSWVKSQGV